MNARQTAFKILKKVFINKSYSNILLNSLNQQKLSNQDKDLIFNLVHGTIANKIYLEYLINQLINYKKTQKELQILLWLAIYQLIFLDAIPDYAVVSQSVELAKTISLKASGFVNAILKKFINNLKSYTKIKLANQELELCIKHSFSYSLYLMLKQQYDKKILEKIVIDNHQIPLIYFRVNSLKISANQFFAKYKDEFLLEKTNLKDCFIANKAIVNSSLYQNGLITIQDKASILVSQVLNPSLNANVLDMCAAPGSKTTHLSAIMNNTGMILANEISKNKLGLIAENISRLGCQNIKLANLDARQIDRTNYFDFILLDAPCSGFGVLKRKPEIKLNFDFKQIKQTVKLQAELLESAYHNLKSNGELVYSTCTINKNENQNQIIRFLNKHQDMVKIYEKQIFGFEENTDGFYICKLKKI
ncbi:16S rRNA (cytosine(967)-C(5))-methyltransferase RsmB [Mycoplasma putrefaciens]|nr:16S rRNA (cytosine(967)-C(5))-methyltransferase RsmB [Mycoplasma putrefaciens]